nr:hypothetical protein CFP56_40084 [Quercus suber]
MGLDGLILSSSENPMTSCAATLALFGSRQASVVDERATDITFEGKDPVLPGVAKTTLISGAKGVSIYRPGPVGPGGPTGSCNPPWYAHGPDDTGKRDYDCTFRGFPPFYLAIGRMVRP